MHSHRALQLSFVALSRLQCSGCGGPSMAERSPNKIAGPAMGSEGGGAIAYVSFQGKIMAMPGWLHSSVRSIIVTKADGNVELLSRDCSTAGERANFLVEALELDVSPGATVVPSSATSPTSRPGVSMLPRSKAGPGTPPLPLPQPNVLTKSGGVRGSASGAVRGGVVWGPPGLVGASGSAGGVQPPPPPVEPPPPAPEPPAGGGRRRKKRLKVHECPPGLPYRVYEHHFEKMHRRGQDAALAGDFSGLLRCAAEEGCRECVFGLLRVDPSSEEMLRNKGRGGWDAAEWAQWGSQQALKVDNDDVANACSYLHGVLDRMKHEGLAVVLGELDYEAEEFSDDEDEEQEEEEDDERCSLRALPW